MADSGLKAVFLQNRPALLRLFAARLGRDEAEDALQDMWFRIDRLTGPPVAQPASESAAARRGAAMAGRSAGMMLSWRSDRGQSRHVPAA